MKDKNIRTKIMTFGTFDGLHKGHLNLLKQARNLSKNPFLIVSIARDINVKKIKGYIPKYNEQTRIALVKSTGLAERVVLGGIRDHMAHIIKERPEIIALGYDQKEYVKNLKTNLKNLGVSVSIVRLESYKPRIYKNKIIQKRVTTAI